MSYPGGKGGAGVYQTIINQMPPHGLYCEPFLGSGAVMREKRPAPVNIGLDLCAGVIAAAGDIPGERPGAWRFEIRDAGDFLASHPWRGEDLIYADPPYLLESRASRRRIYDHELTEISEHKALLELLMSLPAMVMISGYPNPLYDGALESWRTVDFQAMTRGGKTATERLWCNFPEPVALHDYSFLGENYRQRERIKRKRERWRRKIAGLPVLEQRAILAAIADASIDHRRF